MEKITTNASKCRISPDDLKFDKNGLIPAIVVDADTDKVLMLAYMNRESLNITMKKNLSCFFSRSRNELWLKGETSGNYQHVVSITADCDNDTLILRVHPDGPACHTGTYSCFTKPVYACCDDGYNQENAYNNQHNCCTYSGFSLNSLMELIKGRKTSPKEGSYTSYLFDKGIDKILKKIGEESTEVVIAGKDNDKKETIYEISDLIYHVLVLMAQMDISIEDIKKELESRHVIDHKVKQEKSRAN